MNILFISHIWPPSIDGGSQIIANIKKYSKNDHQTLVLTTNCHTTDDFINPNSLAIKVNDQNIFRLPVFKTKIFIYLKKIFKLNLFKLLATGPVFRPIPFLKALKNVLKFKPDLIIAGPFPTTVSLIALFIKKLTKSKLIILPCFHQYDPSFQNKILTRCLKKADFIWTLTDHEKNYLKNKLKINKPKIFTLHPGISNIFFKNTKPKKVKKTINLLFLGNLAAHKNINLLISSFQDISKKFPHTRLTIVGQKTLFFPQIKAHLNTLSSTTTKNISIITKKYTPLQAKNYLNKADIFINPSSQESFGIVFLEAMSQGLPVIGANIPPVAEIINTSKAGLLFKQSNQISLSSKIKKLITNKNLVNILSSNGLKFSKSHTWSNTYKKLINEI